MQRILSRGEIESLDHTLIPRIKLPVLASVFSDRAARLRYLATDHPLRDYLALMAHLCEAQQHVLSIYRHLPGVDETRVTLAQTHAMPPLQAVGWQRNVVWLDMLRHIVKYMADLPDIPVPARDICHSLHERAGQHPDLVEQLADVILADLECDDKVSAPFVMASLQAYWTILVAEFDIDQLPVVSPFGLCPLCGSLPVASLVRVGGQEDGCRYLCCSLCSAQWHLVRVTCSHCEDTEFISFRSIEGNSEAIKAESCDKCGSYRKIFYQHKDPLVDAVADDLASMTLDIMMGEAGYSRTSGNPLLWQDKQP